jgi:hypothetical protein
VPIPKQADVQATLRDFETRLRAVVDRAWKDWLALPGRGGFVFLARVRAVLVFDFIAKHAIAEFSDDPNIEVMAGNRQTVHFLFKDKVLVRFKKGNARGVGSNIETQEVLNFIDPQGVIPGLVPEIMKIEICYRTDAVGLALDEVAIVARAHRTRVWAYPIGPSAPSADVVPMPTRDPDQSPPIVVPRKPLIGDQTQDKE